MDKVNGNLNIYDNAERYKIKNIAKNRIFNNNTGYTEPTNFNSMREGHDYFILYSDKIFPNLRFDLTYSPINPDNLDAMTISPDPVHINGIFGSSIIDNKKVWSIGTNTKRMVNGQKPIKLPKNNAQFKNGLFTITCKYSQTDYKWTEIIDQTVSKNIYIYM